MNKLLTICALTIMLFAAGVYAMQSDKSLGGSTATLGRELADLKLALDAGGISDTEYQALKEKLMNAEKWTVSMSEKGDCFVCIDFIVPRSH